MNCYVVYTHYYYIIIQFELQISEKSRICQTITLDVECPYLKFDTQVMRFGVLENDVKILLLALLANKKIEIGLIDQSIT